MRSPRGLRLNSPHLAEARPQHHTIKDRCSIAVATTAVTAASRAAVTTPVTAASRAAATTPASRAVATTAVTVASRAATATTAAATAAGPRGAARFLMGRMTPLWI